MMLFAYGTLSPRNAPPEIAAIVERLRFVAHSTIQARLYALGPYPGIVLVEDPRPRVHGNVVEVPDDESFWCDVDDYEGVAEGLYRRVATTARGDDGRLYEVQVYEYAQSLEHAKLIESGIWQP